jgi:hypothetical protein
MIKNDQNWNQPVAQDVRFFRFQTNSSGAFLATINRKIVTGAFRKRSDLRRERYMKHAKKVAFSNFKGEQSENWKYFGHFIGWLAGRAGIFPKSKKLIHLFAISGFFCAANGSTGTNFFHKTLSFLQ